MHYLLVGYMFLFIDRPFEVWPALGSIHFERIYMLFTMAYWLIAPGKRWLPNLQHLAYASFAAAVLVAWAMSRWMDQTQNIVEDWLKIVVFYVLLVTTVNTEKGLRTIVIGFVGVMGLYLLHSFREYLGGRHTYRMGITRMIGVDTTLGDPNSFGASIVFALPFIAALWRAEVFGRLGRVLLTGYTGLSILCILLTGSRSSLLGLIVWFAIIILGHRKRMTWVMLFVCAAPLAFVALPDSLQTRFETIINPEVGPENARTSGEGRWQGFVMGFQLWEANPLSGVGPGAWRPATRQPIESHNLYGQLVGELGLLGVLSFGLILLAFWGNFRAVGRIRQAFPEWRNDLTLQVPAAVMTSVFLLLFMGNFGHNLFRFSWLWYGGFLLIARHCLEVRVAAVEAGEWHPEAVSEADDDIPMSVTYQPA